MLENKKSERFEEVNPIEGLSKEGNLEQAWCSLKSLKEKPGIEGLPANDIAQSILEHLEIDEKKPYFIASIEGYIIHANNSYRIMALDSRGELALPPGVNSRGEITQAVGLIFEEVEALEKTMKYRKTLKMDGKEKTFVARFDPIKSDDGRVVAIIGSYENVAEVDKPEKRDHVDFEDKFRDFARSTSDWFWEIDENFKIKTLSERFTALTGKPSVLALGRRLDEVGSFKANLDGNERAFGAFSRKVVFRDQLFELEDINGEAHKFHLNGVPVFDPFTGDFKGYRGAGVDVSKQYKQAEKANIETKLLEKTISELLDRNEQLVRAIERSESRTNEALGFGPDLQDKVGDIMAIAEKIRQSNSPQDKNHASKIKRLARDLLSVFENVEDRCA